MGQLRNMDAQASFRAPVVEPQREVAEPLSMQPGGAAAPQPSPGQQSDPQSMQPGGTAAPQPSPGQQNPWSTLGQSDPQGTDWSTAMADLNSSIAQNRSDLSDLGFESRGDQPRSEAPLSMRPSGNRPRFDVAGFLPGGPGFPQVPNSELLRPFGAPRPATWQRERGEPFLQSPSQPRPAGWQRVWGEPFLDPRLRPPGTQPMAGGDLLDDQLHFDQSTGQWSTPGGGARPPPANWGDPRDTTMRPRPPGTQPMAGGDLLDDQRHFDQRTGRGITLPGVFAPPQAPQDQIWTQQDQMLWTQRSNVLRAAQERLAAAGYAGDPALTRPTARTSTPSYYHGVPGQNPTAAELTAASPSGQLFYDSGTGTRWRTPGGGSIPFSQSTQPRIDPDVLRPYLESSGALQPTSQAQLHSNSAIAIELERRRAEEAAERIRNQQPIAGYSEGFRDFESRGGNLSITNDIRTRLGLGPNESPWDLPNPLQSYMDAGGSYENIRAALFESGTQPLHPQMVNSPGRAPPVVNAAGYEPRVNTPFVSRNLPAPPPQPVQLPAPPPFQTEPGPDLVYQPPGFDPEVIADFERPPLPLNTFPDYRPPVADPVYDPATGDISSPGNPAFDPGAGSFDQDLTYVEPGGDVSDYTGGTNVPPVNEPVYGGDPDFGDPFGREEETVDPDTHTSEPLFGGDLDFGNIQAESTDQAAVRSAGMPLQNQGLLANAKATVGAPVEKKGLPAEQSTAPVLRTHDAPLPGAPGGGGPGPEHLPFTANPVGNNPVLIPETGEGGGSTPPPGTPPTATIVQDLLPEDPGVAQAEIPAGPDAAQAGVTLINPDAATIEDTPTVTAGTAGSLLAETAPTEAPGGDLSPDALTREQMQRITSQDSPLMQLARQRAREQSNRQGLLNTSLAVGAQQRAMVEEAMPMALQDAQTAWANQERNRIQQHDATQQDADRAMQVSISNSEQQSSQDRQNVDRMLQADMFTVEQHNNIATRNSEIYADFLARNADASNRIEQFNVAEINAVRDANAARYAAIQQGNTVEANRHTQFILNMEKELAKSFLAGEQALSLADIQGRFQTLTAANASAASMYEAYFSGVASLMSSKDLSAASIAARIATQKGFLISGLQLLADISDMNLGDYLSGRE